MESTEKSSLPSSFVGFPDYHFHIVRSFISGTVLSFLECFCLYFSKWLEGKWGSIFLSLRWENCVGSDRDNFHHSNPHSAVLYVGGCKGVDNTPEFWVMLSSASTASVLSLQHSPLPPPPLVGWRWARSWKWTEPSHLTKLMKWIFHPYDIRYKRLRTFIIYNVCLPEQTLCVLEPCFPGSGWTSLPDRK